MSSSCHWVSGKDIAKLKVISKKANKIGAEIHKNELLNIIDVIYNESPLKKQQGVCPCPCDQQLISADVNSQLAVFLQNICHFS